MDDAHAWPAPVKAERFIMIKNLDDTFARELREARARTGRSQEEIARTLSDLWDIKWHQTTLAKVESGERKVKLREAYAIAEALGLRLEDLTGETDRGKRQEAF